MLHCVQLRAARPFGALDNLTDIAIPCDRNRVNSLRTCRRPSVRSISIYGSRSGRAESTRSHGSRSFDRRPGPAAAACTATPSNEPHKDHGHSCSDVPNQLPMPRAADGAAGVPGPAEITRMDGRTERSCCGSFRSPLRLLSAVRPFGALSDRPGSITG